MQATPLTGFHYGLSLNLPVNHRGADGLPPAGIPTVARIGNEPDAFVNLPMTAILAASNAIVESDLTLHRIALPPA